MKSGHDVARAMRDLEPGSRVALDLRREGRPLSVYVVARWAVNQPVFAIRVITVQGVAAGANAGTGTQPLDHVHAAQVAQFCVPRIAGTLFTNDLDVTRAAFEALPWVRRATVRRQWPNRLVVALEEHQALARWNDEDGNRFVSVAGEAFDAPGEKVIGAALPLLLGPEGTEKEVAQRFRDFSERLARIAQTPAVVALSPRQAWTIRLKRSEAGPTPTAGETPHEGLLLDQGVAEKLLKLVEDQYKAALLRALFAFHLLPERGGQVQSVQKGRLRVVIQYFINFQAQVVQRSGCLSSHITAQAHHDRHRLGFNFRQNPGVDE